MAAKKNVRSLSNTVTTGLTAADDPQISLPILSGRLPPSSYTATLLVYLVALPSRHMSVTLTPCYHPYILSQRLLTNAE